jgi:hypothetical protein
MKFEEWFNKAIIVSQTPNNSVGWFLEKYSNVDVVINVSDDISFEIYRRMTGTGKEYWWFPMNERMKDMGLNSIYGAMLVMAEAELTSKTVFLHCIGGVNRSQLVNQCYYYIRTGRHYTDEHCKDTRWVNEIERACNRGYLPPFAELSDFLLTISDKIGVQVKEKKLHGGFLTKAKIDTIHNF